MLSGGQLVTRAQIKMTGATPEVRSNKRKPREQREDKEEEKTEQKEEREGRKERKTEDMAETEKQKMCPRCLQDVPKISLKESLKETSYLVGC